MGRVKSLSVARESETEPANTGSVKMLLKTFLVLVVFISGYALGNYIPWSGFSFSGGERIAGSAKL